MTCQLAAPRAEALSAEALFAEGWALQQAGAVAAARRCFDRLLAQQPDYAHHLHAHGLAAHARGEHRRAAEAIAGAVALCPDLAPFHHNLGLVCASAGQTAWAEHCFARAAALDPARADTQYNLGAMRLRHGRPRAALPPLQEAVALAPDAADAHALLGLALLRMGRHQSAELALATALARQPDSATAHSNIAALLVELDRLDAGEAHYRTALGLTPGDGVIWCNYGMLLRNLGRLQEAEAALAQSIRLQPGRPDAHSLLGNVLTTAGRFAEAEQSFDAALALDPDHADTHYNRGNLHLLTGRLQAGWAGFAWRSRRPGAPPPRVFEQPHWEGAPAGEAGLLLYAEQGFGDTLQMVRYVPQIAAHSRVILQVQPGLQRLLAGLPGADAVLAAGDALPPFAVQCSLMSVPQVLGTTLDSIPGRSPYLWADPAATARWRRRLAGLPGLRVGLAWAGNPHYRADNRRSIAPERLVALDGLAGVSFVSLQIGRRLLPLPLQDWTAELQDFADTAALVAALDLVITVDTAIVHLAGALGRPVWLLNRFDTCWRWLLHRTDSPWYPSLRQFRQSHPGDWNGVLAAVRAALLAGEGARPDHGAAAGSNAVSNPAAASCLPGSRPSRA